MKKGTVIILAFLFSLALQAQQSEIFPVTAEVIKQVLPDTIFWGVKETYILLKPTADSLEAVRYIGNIKSRQRDLLIAEKKAGQDRQAQIDSLLKSIEREGNITESFDSTTIRKVVGIYALVVGTETTNVRLNRNYNIVDVNTSKVIGEWKLISENRITIITDAYETDAEWNAKQDAFVSTSKVKLRLARQKSK